jgi:hypothetical protein
MSSPTRRSSDPLAQAVQEFLASHQGTDPPHAARSSRKPVAPPAAATADPVRTAGGLRSAYDEVLEREAALKTPAPPPRRSRWQRARGPILLLGCSLAAAYVWLGNPSWLARGPGAVLPAPTTGLSARRQLLAVALEIEDFRHSTGRLPAALDEMGLVITHITYLKLPDGRYELRTGNGPHATVYLGVPTGVAEVKEVGP